MLMWPSGNIAISEVFMKIGLFCFYLIGMSLLHRNFWLFFLFAMEFSIVRWVLEMKTQVPFRPKTEPNILHILNLLQGPKCTKINDFTLNRGGKLLSDFPPLFINFTF